MTDEQQLEEGRRMFQVFAAKMFEQRVLAAYRYDFSFIIFIFHFTPSIYDGNKKHMNTSDRILNYNLILFCYYLINFFISFFS